LTAGSGRGVGGFGTASPLLRNCTLEQLAGFAIDECEAEIGGALTQTANDALAVVGVVRDGSRITVDRPSLRVR
jgi:hypothetical protein